MKIRVILQQADSIDEAVVDAVEDSIKVEMPTADDEERAAVREIRLNKAWDFLDQWVRFGEIVTLVFDTDAGTAVVERRND